MKEVNYIALAIPFFFILIGIEVLVAWRKKKDVYRFNDSINDLSLGMTQQALGLFTKGIVFGGYILLYDKFRVIETMDTGNIGLWVLCFLGVDFFYYWFHRSSHEINGIWATHVVHHQSEEYNLTVALRQSAIQNLFSSVFYWPLAIVGFPPVMFVANSSFNTLYQFWIHTRLIGKMGPFGWIFNTPSHHRVHHGRNPKYIDKNHAGTLIIWDRLFGTFQAEEEEPTFGITTQLSSWNPIWANVHYWKELWDQARANKGLDKLRVWYKPPGWHPDYNGGFKPPPALEEQNTVKYDAGHASRLSPYILFQFVFSTILTTMLLFMEKQWPVAQLLSGAILLVLALVSYGAQLETRAWAIALELARVIGTAAWVILWFGTGWIGQVAGLLAALSVIWFLAVARQTPPSTDASSPLPGAA